MKDSYSIRTEGMGFSGGATMHIPNVFYGRMAIGDISFQGDEIVGGMDCYKLVDKLKDRRWSFWIGKTDLFIRKFEETHFSKPTGITEPLDESTITNSLTKLGVAITPESKEWMLQAIQNLKTQAEAESKPVYVELHENIVVNEPISLNELIPQIPNRMTPSE